MTSTRIEASADRIARAGDILDLAELLFPGNRNQQHAFVVIWFILRWQGPKPIADLEQLTSREGVSRRTFQRVRAKLRRLGLIDHVSRFNRQHGYQEGWVWSGRISNSIQRLADLVDSLADAENAVREKDETLISLALARAKADPSNARNAFSQHE